jgi:hypothetical protein
VYRFCPCATWSSCGCTPDTPYIMVTAYVEVNYRTHSSLFSACRNLLLKTRALLPETGKKPSATVEVGLTPQGKQSFRFHSVRLIGASHLVGGFGGRFGRGLGIGGGGLNP